MKHGPGVVVISVRDSAQKPIANISVTSESHSGTAGRFITDPSGIASLLPGEAEVIAIWVGSRRIPTFRLTDKFFVPHCGTGILFEAIVKKEPNQAPEPTAAAGRGSS